MVTKRTVFETSQGKGKRVSPSVDGDKSWGLGRGWDGDGVFSF